MWMKCFTEEILDWQMAWECLAWVRHGISVYVNFLQQL